MKTSEAIAMLEKNPKLRFKNTRHDGVETVIYISDYGYFNAVVTHNGKVKDYSKGLYNFYGNFKPNADWQLVREPVPAWEAIKAFCEGKSVSYVTPEGDEWKLENCFTYYSDRLINSKWYIND